MIKSFKCKETRKAFEGRRSKFGADVIERIEDKLAILDAAASIEDLRSPPSNRLEKLDGDRKGQHSIRINKQWRICFKWTASGPTDVEVCDYH